MTHWHAFGYTGSYPPDSEAKNPSSAVRPLAVIDWFRKPASMRRGVYADAETAYKWLEAELRETLPPERLGAALSFHRMHLELGQDAYAGGYTPGGGIYVRCLLTCPRTGADPRPVTCPEPPS